MDAIHCLGFNSGTIRSRDRNDHERSNQRRTDLNQAIEATRKKYKMLRGVVLMSDGDWNAGLPPVQAAMGLRLDDVPLFGVPIGSPTRLPDVELLSLDAPTFGVAGKTVRIPFTVESSLPRDLLATLTLKTSEGEEIKQEFKIAAMGRTPMHSLGSLKESETIPLH